jgi:subtilisin family serine protease
MDVTRRRTLLRAAGLVELVAASGGHSDVRLALIDGHVDVDHPAFGGATIERVGDPGIGRADVRAGAHATFMASMLTGIDRPALGLCRGCALVSVPAVTEAMLSGRLAPPAIAWALATGVREATGAGAAAILLGVELTRFAGRDFAVLLDAVEAAARVGVRTVVAAGNTGCAAQSELLTAVGAVPVGMAADDGSPDRHGSWGAALGARGLMAPGRGIPGAALGGRWRIASGSSYSAAFVVAAFALLQSMAPQRPAGEIWEALLHNPGSHGVARSLVPPSLDGDAACARLMRSTQRGVGDGR